MRQTSCPNICPADSTAVKKNNGHDAVTKLTQLFVKLYATFSGTDKQFADVNVQEADDAVNRHFICCCSIDGAVAFIVLCAKLVC